MSINILGILSCPFRKRDYDQDQDLLGQHAAIDIPSGSELSLLSKLPDLNNEEIETEDKAKSAEPRVHLKATYSDLADEIKDDHDEKLFNLKNVIQSNLSTLGRAYTLTLPKTYGCICG